MWRKILRLKAVSTEEPKQAYAGTHLEVHPLVQRPPAVEFTQKARGSDAEGGVGCRAPSTGHIAEEVVPQLSQQPRTAQQRDRSAGLYRPQRSQAFTSTFPCMSTPPSPQPHPGLFEICACKQCWNFA